MNKILCAALVATGLAFVSGCSDDGKKAEPKLAPGVQEDPRLKPASAGSGGGDKPQGKPQENTGQGAVKGD